VIGRKTGGSFGTKEAGKILRRSGPLSAPSSRKAFYEDYLKAGRREKCWPLWRGLFSPPTGRAKKRSSEQYYSGPQGPNQTEGYFLAGSFGQPASSGCSVKFEKIPRPCNIGGQARGIVLLLLTNPGFGTRSGPRPARYGASRFWKVA